MQFMNAPMHHHVWKPKM